MIHLDLVENNTFIFPENDRVPSLQRRRSGPREKRAPQSHGRALPAEMSAIKRSGNREHSPRTSGG